MLQLFKRFYNAQPKLLEVVSKLRDQTSLSMNLCRKAAIEANYDVTRALEILSKSVNTTFNSSTTGAANFGKEGLVGIFGSAERKCLIELRCDSDFVAQNSVFKDLADSILTAVINGKLDNVSEIVLPDSNKSIKESIDYFRSKFRENIGLESVKMVEISPSSKTQAVGHYIHQKLGPHSGKIGSLVKIETETQANLNQMEEIGNCLARQVVALGDKDINLPKLLNSDYLFAPVGTVRDFIASHEAKINAKISVLDIVYVKIK